LNHDVKTRFKDDRVSQPLAEDSNNNSSSNFQFRVVAKPAGTAGTAQQIKPKM
jgi:hypothetical protein